MVTPRQIFEHQTVAGASPRSPTPLAAAESEQGPVEGHGAAHADPALVLRRHGRPSRTTSTRPAAASPASRSAPAPLARALAALVAHHDALRLRFVADGGGLAGAGTRRARRALPLSSLDLSALPRGAPRRRARGRRRRRCRPASTSRAARCFRAARLRPRRGASRSGCCSSPITWSSTASPGASCWTTWRPPTRQAAAGSAVACRPRRTSWKRWAERLAGHARSAEALGELPYWLSASADAARLAPLPRDGEPGEDADRVRRDRARARGHAGAARRGGGGVPHPGQRPAARRPGAGFRALDGLPPPARPASASISRGTAARRSSPASTCRAPWAGSRRSSPSRSRLARTPRPGEVLRAVKETLRAIPRRGLGLRAAALPRRRGGRAARRGLPAPEVAFNYLGQLDGALGASARWRRRPSRPGRSGARARARAPR